MGNNGSRTGHISHQLEAETTWTQSFPRNTHGVYHQHKVLPEKGITKKLRSTNNGEILHAGGTISGRQHHQKTLSLERENKSFKIFRTSSVSSNPSDDPREYGERPYTRYVSHHGGVNRYAAQRLENRNFYREQMKKYGSEPDLRNSPSDRNESGRYKGKKKYKAPAPPNHGPLEKLNCYQWNESTSDPIVRRNRLFKTKSELQKRCSSPINVDVRLEDAFSETKHNSSNKNNSRNMLNVQLRNNSRKCDTNNRLSLPEINRASAVPEFQSELKEVVQRLKSTKRNTEIESSKDVNHKYDNKNEESAKEKIKTLDHNISKADHVKCRLQLLDLNKTENKNMLNTYSDRGQPSGKESTPEKKEYRIDLEKKEQPSKLYYFGMKESVHEDFVTTDFTDTNTNNFSSTFQSYKDIYPNHNSSGSDLSSEMEMDGSHMSTNGIALQLRPILPKKQLEIPRFSPAAAWKQLSAVESNFTPSTAASEDLPIYMEDRIEKLSRQPPPPTAQTGPRSSYDKSGDSGISGDAGPVGFDDSPDGMDIRHNIDLPLVLNRSQGMSWTPQQDLGEDESTSDEDDINTRNDHILKATSAKFTSKTNVFSLSLPRDNQLSSYIRNFGNPKDIDVPNSFSYECGNWLLSKSAPNSLNNGLNSLEAPKSHKLEEPKPQVSNNVSRVMYLPESDNLYKKNQNMKSERSRCKEIFRERSRSVESSNLNNMSRSSFSKSFENLIPHVESSFEPENLQDPPHKKVEALKVYKPKRFTFQSTIRQIERKRLAEKLSKEAEKKEKQRLSELAAMQKVEEEFQRKRAREKASIRQQLRLFSLDDTVWSNGQSNGVKDVPVRADPDGAVSSAASSPMMPLEKKINLRAEEYPERSHRQRVPSELSDENVKKTQMTLILSEYRQPQREYKDFRGSPRYMAEFGDAHHPKQTTIHPQVTCNMPKASNTHQGSSNYRKQFAHGVKTNRSGDSTYSDDSQPVNRNSSPKIYRSERSPISRF